MKPLKTCSIIFLVYLLFFSSIVYSLTVANTISNSSYLIPGSPSYSFKFYLKIVASEGVPEIVCDNSINGRLKLSFKNSAIQNYFDDKEIYVFQKAFPTAKSHSLQQTYEVHTNNPAIMSELLILFPNIYPLTEPKTDPILLDDEEPTISFFLNKNVDNILQPKYYPNDPLFSQQSSLALINAQSAWDVSQGDPAIHIGISDTKIDIHEDVEPKIDYRLPNYYIYWHGLAVAGLAAAATDNGLGISAIGFNCRLFSGATTYGDLLQLSQLGAKVVNASWVASLNSQYIQTDQDVINEIHNNGTVVVAGAGNGPLGTNCGGGGNALCYPASYNHVISVSSVGHLFDIGTPGNPPNNWKDVHEERIGESSSCHTHNDSVDLTAPGYNVLSTYLGYGGTWGTSFSAPQVAGLAALLYSINHCLSPDDVEKILKTTAVNIDNISNNIPYSGKLGAGRIDAGAAAHMAIGIYSPIASAITWSTPKFITDDLIIESGGVLTITNVVKFASSAKLIIKPQGKLIIDGGHLTNLTGCTNTFWPGILLLGKTNENQYPWGNPDDQGVLIMLHDAKIENALVAVSIGDPALPLSNGGVLRIDGGQFINNLHGIDLRPYTNHHPIYGDPIPNASYIKNCNFLVNDKLIGGTFYAHVTLNHVDGIEFYNCLFENARPQLLNLEPQGYGILSYDANFLVLPTCTSQVLPCPENNLLKCKFKGLYYGISANMVSTSYNFIVDNTIFESNKRAIFSTGINGVSITNSDFNIGNNVLPPFDNPVNAEGIVINTGTGYTITENTLYSPVGCTTNNVGIRIRQTGGDENQVYKNDLRRLTYGIMASGTNRNSSTSGLQILCNHLENNTFAIYVNPDSLLHEPWTGIRTVQGNSSIPVSAGNTFLNNGTNQGDICNLTTNAFYYLYSSGIVTIHPLL